MRLFAIAALMLACAACSSSGDSSGGGSHSVQVTPQEFGKDWPLTVHESGVLICDAAGDMGGIDGIYLTINGTTYALNGTARNSGDYPDINPIWAKDPSIPIHGARKNIGVLIDKGLAIC